MKGRHLLFLVLLPLPCVSQDDFATLDRIEVTGSRITYRDLLDTPAISLVKPGDYLSQRIELVNDTRSEAGRREEIGQTIENMLARAGDRFEVHSGLGPMQRGKLNFNMTDDSEREQVSRVWLQVRTDLKPDESAVATIEELRGFIEDTRRAGRTEIDINNDTALGMQRPERYRYELLQAIAADTERLRQLFGSQCEFILDGLNSRIDWERVSAGELLLYIPYTLQVGPCGGGKSSVDVDPEPAR